MAGTLAAAACGSSRDPVELFNSGAYAQSHELFLHRAEAGDLMAQNYLGIHYYLGAGVERDFGEAARWFERAALGKHSGAQRNLGILYLQGLGVPQDYIRAYGWLYQAYMGGNASARAYLSFMGDAMTGNQIMKSRDWVRKYMNGRKRD